MTVSNIACFGTDDRQEAMRWRRRQAKRLNVLVDDITVAMREHKWTIHEIETLAPADAHQLYENVIHVKPGLPGDEEAFTAW